MDAILIWLAQVPTAPAPITAPDAVPSSINAYTGLMLALSSLVGGLITLCGKLIIEYRKAADAGQLKIVQADGVNLRAEVGMLKTQQATMQTSIDDCHQDRDELRGEVRELRSLVVRDTSATTALAKEHGETSAKVDEIQKKMNGHGP